MDRNEEFIFAAVFLLVGLCVMVLFGRAAGILVGGCLAGIAFVATRPGGVRVAVLTLLCLAGIAITVHAGATPELIVDDLSHLLSGSGGLQQFVSLGPDSDLRVGFGLVGGGLWALALTLFSGWDDEGPSA